MEKKKSLPAVGGAALLFLAAAAALYLYAVKPALAYRKAAALFEERQWEAAEEAFEQLGGYRDSEIKADGCRLEQTKSELAAGRYSRARRLLSAVQDKEAAAAAVRTAYETLRQSGDPELTPAFLKAFAGRFSDKEISGLLCAWYRELIGDPAAGDRVRALREAFSLSEEEKSTLSAYILTETPALCGLTEDGRRWFAGSDVLQSVSAAADGLFGEDGAPEMQAFRQYLVYLRTLEFSDLPDGSALRRLWDARTEMPEFCATGDPLLAFLEGRWESSAGRTENFVLTRTDRGFSLKYRLPANRWTVGSLEAVRRGLSIVDDEGNELARICGIAVTGPDTIELQNKADGRHYDMTLANK